MKKLTDAYVSRLLRLSSPNTEFDIQYPANLIECKRAALHLGRVIRFKEKEHNGKLTDKDKTKAEAVYQDAKEYYDQKHPG